MAKKFISKRARFKKYFFFYMILIILFLGVAYSNLIVNLGIQGTVSLSKYKVRATITLDSTGSTTSGSTEIYEINSLGYFLDSSYLNEMTASTNSITIPTKTNYLFMGYFTEPNGEGVEYIDAVGRLTSNADNTHFTSDGTLYAYFSKELYDVLKRETVVGTYAAKYTGSHQDSMDASKSTEEIYHWYGGTTITNMNNVVFAGLCWQMIRTTDTGGVRLLYNGEPTVTGSGNNISYDCGTTRPGHIGTIKSKQSLSGSYYYASSYTTSVSGITTTYTLVNPVQVTVNSTDTLNTINNIAVNNPYTCKKTSATGTCTTLYKVDSQSNGTEANVYASTYRDYIGAGAYNTNYNSPAYVGYMYNSSYPSSTTMISNSFTMLSRVTMSSSNLTTYGGYYFGDSYSMSGNSHVLTNPVQGNTIANYPSGWVGKYMCQSSSSSSCSTLYYISAIDTSGSSPIIYRTSISSGKEYNDSSYKYLFGDSIIDNGNGTFEISGNVREVIQKDWGTEYSSKLNKYVCMPGYYTYSNNKYICSDNGAQKVGALRYVTETTITDFTATSIYKYGFGISASGSSYQLVGNNNEDGTLQYIYNFPNTSTTNCFTNSGDSISQCGYKTLSKSHYTCYNLSGICSTYYYIDYSSPRDVSGVEITGGKYVSTNLTDTNNILYEMLYANNVNTTNSTIKTNIESWYQNTLIGYDDYIDDTIYCNNRSIREEGGVKQFGGWNPNGGITDTNYILQFNEYNVTKDLSCPNITDQFSISNTSAPLTYKVGLMSSPEMNLLNHNNARVTSYYYWLGSPYEIDHYPYVLSVSSSGSIGTRDTSNSGGGLRPAVSLVTGIEYSRGDGSTTNPYVIDVTPNTISLSSNLLRFRGTTSGSQTLTATTNMEGTITWESSNPSVATVNNGVVTAVGLGTATITAKIGILRDYATVQVLTPFEYDSWDTIITNVKAGNRSEYTVGSTKKVELGNDLGTHTIRIANTSTPPECSTAGFSETACGFVLEFADIITTHRMNPYDNTGLSGDGNVGGWPASEMRTYVNGTIYNALPSELKSGIINTTVVSGHGSTSGETNFTSTDKLYLLSPKEVWGKEGTSNVINYDSAETETRQLDYYQAQGVTTSNYSGAIKQYNSSNYYWWLRSAHSNYTSNFFYVYDTGVWDRYAAFSTRGVSPAFRIA